jgi:hypothetical protein
MSGSAPHVVLEAIPDHSPRGDLDPDVRCRCRNCGAVLLRQTVAGLGLADFLDGAVPFLARHSACPEHPDGMLE